MPRAAYYWLTFQATHPGFDLFVNDFPVARLPRSGGQRMPVNEYLRRGEDVVEVRAGAAPPTRDGKGTLEFDVASGPVSEPAIRRLTETSFSYRAADLTPGKVVAQLRSVEPDIDTLGRVDGLAQLSAADRSVLVQALAHAADLWRAGDAAGLLRWMAPYVEDYTAAYPDQTVALFSERFTSMVQAFTAEKAKVVFDPDRTRFEACGQGRAADALNGQGGAAIRLVAEDLDYDFWTILGRRGGDVMLLR